MVQGVPAENAVSDWSSDRQGINDVRSTFLDFFVRNGHALIPSAPLVPRHDPTLLFVNAGMVPFKNIFTGVEKPAAPRATSAQKCVRAGGKHNDLDNVGYTARHHTFFEMLGNFSFGDYFKDDAIKLAWQLVTEDFDLPADRLTVTVYAEDGEAFDLWRKISGLPESRILRIATADNFWSMGDTGPCGPCSEIFFDHGDHIPGGPPGSPDEDGDRFVEIWNLVFMQFDQQADGARHNLPKPSIDTGMGLERMAAVQQGTHDNYETDLFRTLIEAQQDLLGRGVSAAEKASPRVIADHLRAACFLLADGVQPSNEGRGYVLRRIMRRAMRHAHLLGAADPLMHRLVPVLTAGMGAAYPELVRAEPMIADTLKTEETRFRETLARGLRLLDEAAETMGQGDILPGAVAFKLYDTYGFPLDLTQDALRRRGISVDEAGFAEAMAHQRAEARAAWSGSGAAAEDSAWFALAEKYPQTEFDEEAAALEAHIAVLLKDGVEVDALEKGESGTVILDCTPFYAESGGQVGDIGVIGTAHGGNFVVTDTQKRVGRFHSHEGRVESGRLTAGATVKAEIDVDRRARIRANHSATHLLHAALRNILGAHVAQKGSLVAPDRLRFDFSHGHALTTEELTAIEDQVNDEIRANAPVTVDSMSYDAALDAGAIALFGEKYGDEVRVLRMGRPGPRADQDGRSLPYSVELCGGTHVRRTGDIQLLKIVSESAVGGGTRRIEAVTGASALAKLREAEQMLQAAAAAVKAAPQDLPGRLEALIAERRKLERELSEVRKALALKGNGSATGAPAQEPESIGGLNVLTRALEGVPPKDLRGLADEAKASLGSGVVAIATSYEGKAGLVVGVTKDLTETVSAVDLVKTGAAALGGKGGGGRPDFAQAGGPQADQAPAALAAIKKALAERG